MIVMAGLAAVLVDVLIVRIPQDIVCLGTCSQKGSPLTELLQDCSVRHDNWLSDWSISDVLPRDAESIACVLRVISLRDDLAVPIDPYVLSQLAVSEWAQPASHTRGRTSDPVAGAILLARCRAGTTKERQAAPSSRRRRRDSQPPDHLLRCSAGAMRAPPGRYVVDGRLSTSPVTTRVYPFRLVRART